MSEKYQESNLEVKKVLHRLLEKAEGASIFEDSNQVIIEGRVVENMKYSHKDVLNQRYYKLTIAVRRASRTEDLIPVIIPEYVLVKQLIINIKEGQWAEIAGEFRSYNKMGEDQKSHLKLFVLARAMNIFRTKYEESMYDANFLYIDGFLCKKPNFRRTPKGHCITDLLLAINRKYRKSDYIPCIAWEEDAILASTCNIGDRVKLIGRIQSREYDKRMEEDPKTIKKMTAHEISVMKFQEII